MNDPILKLYWRICLVFTTSILFYPLIASDVVSAAVLEAGSLICGIQADNTVVCWSGDSPPSGTFSQISVGSGHACGIRTDNSLACWGQNSKGQATPPNGSFSQVSAGNQYSCGVLTDSTVVCWGNNSHGQATPLSGTFSQVSAAKEHTCGIRTDSTVACWGNNNAGQTTPPSGTFLQVSAGSTSYTCGIRTDNAAVCWGGGTREDQDGRGWPPSGKFSQVSASNSWFTCWLRTDNTVLCSGTNEFEVSESLRPPYSTCICKPLRPGCLCESPSGIYSHVSAGTCAIKMDNTVICWGKGTRGELMPPAGLIVKSSDPDACLLYGVHDDGNETQFFIINSGTSEVHVRSKLDKHYNITALDIHPRTNQVYAALRSSGNSKNNGYLYEVINGAQRIEEVGEIRFKEVEGLTFHPDGTLWGWAPEGGLFQIKNGENNEPNPEVVEVILAYDREAEEVVEVEVNDLTWNMVGTILYGIGRVLYKNQDPDDTPSQQEDKLWAYNASEGTVSTACDNIMDSLDDVEALEMLPDDTLLLGFTKNEKLTFWTLDVQTCDIIRQEEIATAYHDVKGLARPDCSYPYVDDTIPNQ
jgi:hypothetical protein